MLKHFYKFILVTVLSCSMLNMSIVTAVAATGTGTGTGTGKGSSGDYQNTETLDTGGGDDSNLMATLTMVAIGLITSRLYQCKMTADMIVAAIAGGVYIAADIVLFALLDDALKKLETDIKRDEKGKIEQQQAESLKKLRKSYEDAKDTATAKKWMQIAAGVAFAAAAVVSYFQAISLDTAVTTVTTALTTAVATCTASFTASCAGAGATCYYPFQTGAIYAGVISPTPWANEVLTYTIQPSNTCMTTDNTNMVTLDTNATTLTAQCPQGGAPVSAAVAALTGVKQVVHGYCTVPPAVSYQSASQYLYAKNEKHELHSPDVLKSKTILESVQSLFLAKAQAADLFSMMGITSTAAIIYLVATSKTLSTFVDNMLYSPTKRAIIWGILGGLAYSASTATDNVIKKIDSDIAAIDETLKPLNGLGTELTTKVLGGNGDTTNVGLNQSGFSIAGNGDVNLNGGTSGSFPCLTGKDPAKCGAVDTKLSKMEIAQFPSIIQTQIGNITSMGNGVNGTKKMSGSSMAAAKSLAGASNAINKELANQKKLLQNKLDAAGKKFNLDKEQSDMAAALNKAMAQGLSKANKSAGAMLASFGGNSNTATDAKTASPKKAAPVIPPQGVIDLSSLSTAKTNSDNDKKAEAPVVDTNVKAAASIDEYDLKNDITQDKEKSIFDLISTRYQKSAYERLFKKVKSSDIKEKK